MLMAALPASDNNVDGTWKRMYQRVGCATTLEHLLAVKQEALALASSKDPEFQRRFNDLQDRINTRVSSNDGRPEVVHPAARLGL